MSVDRDLVAAIAAMPPQPVPAGIPTLEEARGAMSKLIAGPFIAWQKAQSPDESTYTVTDRSVPVEGGEITLRCVAPVVEGDETFPLVFHLHGGGFSLGDIDFDDYYLRRLAVDLKLSVVNVDYRLAPEHPFPTAVNDSFAALKWVVNNAPSLKADLSKGFILVGDSAGGNLAAVLAHEARDDPFFDGRRPTGQLLRESWLAHPSAYPERLKEKFRSMDENAQFKSLPFALSHESLDFVMGAYQAPLTDPRFSPFYRPSHAGLPPAYLQAMGLDTIRDDAVVYEQELQAAGVKTKLVVYPGVYHSCHAYFPTTPVSAKVWEDARAGIEWLLRGGE